MSISVDAMLHTRANGDNYMDSNTRARRTSTAAADGGVASARANSKRKRAAQASAPAGCDSLAATPMSASASKRVANALFKMRRGDDTCAFLSTILSKWRAFLGDAHETRRRCGCSANERRA